MKPVAPSELLDALMLSLGEVSPGSQPLLTRHSLAETRRRLHLLLAEDNRVNQTLAVRLLGKLGHSVDLAQDGLEAVERWQAGGARYDAILMDVDMPRMNGHQATAEIRRLEAAAGAGAGGGSRRIPIIAMTAHAMVGAREQCLAQGMDGYLAKPIDTQALWQELERIGQGLLAAGAPLAAAPAPAQSPSQLPASSPGQPPVTGLAATHPLRAELARLAVVDFRAARETMDQSQELFEILREQFQLDAPRQMAAVATAVQNGDARAMREAAHALAGMVAVFGAARARRAAAALEARADQGDAAELAVCLDALQQAFDALQAELAAYVWPAEAETAAGSMSDQRAGRGAG
jgi:CheY-like chemotaxis protein